ncbi:hypothetical protein FVK13_09940, partial [Campylobacter coli]|nr:hypothetical protein [Campylobacter coli]EDO6752053.1 hypothetical protein [Campylobacter coli]
MGKGIKIDFAKVNFHIKEFQKVYILENCKLCFYSPFHLQTQNGKEVKKIEKKGKSKIYLIDEDGKTVDIDKTSEQNKIKAKEEKSKNINSKDIGDAGEYAASMLFTKRSTRYLSNRRKIDANFNTHSFNHTIPDFLVTLNDYPTLVEVKNVQDQALTEQISFELKLAREYELDYLFICNHYTKLVENIAGGNVTVKNEKEIKLKE